MFLTINGECHDLWRAVDQEGNVLDILVQCRRDKQAAKKFFRNNIVEQDHRAVKRIAHPTLGFNSFGAAPGTIAGVELIPMIRKRQLVVEEGDETLTAAEQCYTLAA